MHKDPEWSLLPTNTPPTIHLLLRRCLTKDRKRRLHDIADARVELEEAIADPTSSSLGLARAALDVKTRALPTRAQMTVFVIVLPATAVGVWFARPTPELHRPVRRFEFAQDLKPRVTVISPDGTMVAFESE
ncbi:MAG: hypothetical protein IID38_06600 [Planctomycetes bacterium]|nr:hypothetical protein [Planctomycetota bacterium]